MKVLSRRNDTDNNVCLGKSRAAIVRGFKTLFGPLISNFSPRKTQRFGPTGSRTISNCPSSRKMTLRKSRRSLQVSVISHADSAPAELIGLKILAIHIVAAKQRGASTRLHLPAVTCIARLQHKHGSPSTACHTVMPSCSTVVTLQTCIIISITYFPISFQYPPHT